MKFTYEEYVSALRGQFEASGYHVSQLADDVLHALHRQDGRAFRIFVPQTENASTTADEVFAKISSAASDNDPSNLVLAMPTLLHLGRILDGRALSTAVKSLDHTSGKRVFVRSFGQLYRDSFQQQGGSIGIDVELGLGEGGKIAGRAKSLFDEREYHADNTEHPDTVSYSTPLRVDQPFRCLNPETGFSASSSEQADIFSHLVDEFDKLASDKLVRPKGISIDFISGRAAQGKSVLFANLIRHQRTAASGRQYPVPYPFYAVPHSLIDAEQDLRQKGVSAIDALFESIAVAEAGGAISTRMLEWMVTEGLASLSLDGMDEFFFGQVGFIDALEQRLLQPGSRAHLRIFLRDSLFATDEALPRFIGRLDARDDITLRIFELSSWEGDDQTVRPELLQQFASLYFKDRDLANSQADIDNKIHRFIEIIQGEPHLGRLAGSPFFLTLMADHFSDPTKGGEIRKSLAKMSDLELLEEAVQRILNREWSKILQADPSGESPAIFALTTLSTSQERVLHSLTQGISSLEPVKWFVDAFGAPRTDSEYDEVNSSFLDARKIEAAQRDMRALIEDLALAARRGTSGGEALSTKKINAIYTAQNLPLATSSGKARAQMILQRFALFSRAGAGEVQFTHEIIADYLAGRAVVRSLKRKPKQDLKTLLGAPPVDDTGYFSKTLLAAFPSGHGLNAGLLTILATRT